MIAEGIKALVDLATRAGSPQKIESGNPRASAYVIAGEVHMVDIEPPPRDHKAGTLGDLIALANRFAETGDLEPVVWYDAEAVVLVIDDEVGGENGNRIEKATLPLATSDVFARLVKLRADPAAAWMNQKDFIRLLRIELAGTLADGVLLNPTRKIVWSTSDTSTGTVKRGAESMGREINSRATTDGGDLPDEVKLNVPVYKTPGERERYPMNCSVEIDPGDNELQLMPLPDEIERVRQLALASIAERLASELKGVPAYQGKP
jgi:hypothetical protein